LAGKQAFSGFGLLEETVENEYGVYCGFGICVFECSDIFACRANVSVYECFKPPAETVFAVPPKSI
jgi:hypothetical protein